MQNGDMSNEDYLRASLEDSVEICVCSYGIVVKIDKMGVKKNIKNLAKIAIIEEVVRDKLLEADESM